MKRKFLTVFIVILVALMVITPALAYDGFVLTVNDGYGANWTLGGTLSVQYWNGTALVDCGSVDESGPSPYTYSFSPACDPANNDVVIITFNPNAAPPHNPASQTTAFGQNNAGGNINLTVQINAGPTAVELTDFSVTSQTSSTWLPFALLVGSVVLVGGAVAVIRKRKA